MTHSDLSYVIGSIIPVWSGQEKPIDSMFVLSHIIVLRGHLVILLNELPKPEACFRIVGAINYVAC